jgi:hypothetical protein
MKKEKLGVIIISVYKFLINLARIIAGSIILIAGGKFSNIAEFLLNTGIIAKSDIIKFLASHLTFPSQRLTIIFAATLVLLSYIEILFVLALLSRRRFGAVGIIILSVIWTLMEIVFISRFIIASELIIFLINLVIVFMLIRLLIKPHGYFRKKN